VKVPWDVLCMKCCSVCHIHGKIVNFCQCDITTADIKTNKIVAFIFSRTVCPYRTNVTNCPEITCDPVRMVNIC